jgi:TPR repeat protein
MKKTILSLLLLTSFNCFSVDNYLTIPVTNYFPDRSTLSQELNEDIRLLGGFSRIETLVNNNDATANYIIAQMTRLGIGYEQSAEKAYKYFKISADNGDARSLYYLGMLMMDKDPVIKLSDNKVDIQKGFNLIKMSAENGHPDAQYIIGLNYIAGDFFVKNYNFAMFWLTRAVQSGHKLAMAEKLKLINDYNLSEKRSYEKVRMKFINGSIPAMVDMAKIYIEGYFVPRDYKKAYELLLSASRLGNKEAASIIYQLEESYSEDIK